MKTTESIATLPPFGPIEGHKWFFQISSQWSLTRTGLQLSLSAKYSFYLPEFDISRSYRTASGRSEHLSPQHTRIVLARFHALFPHL
jgi:hypothetical protein